MSTKCYLVRKANGIALGKLRRYQSNNVSDKLKSVCDEISVGIYIGDMSSEGFFLINFLNDKYYTRGCIESFDVFIKKALLSGNWYISTDDGSIYDDGESTYKFISSRIVYNIENRVYTPDPKDYMSYNEWVDMMGGAVNVDLRKLIFSKKLSM